MNQQIEKMIGGCRECLKHRPSKNKEPLMPHPVPTQPWEKIGSDLFELAGTTYIIITDYYSLWPEVYELKHARSQQVITVMKDVFARHGIPTQLITDNGSQYKSREFKRFATSWDFEHTTSSPRYPRSNGLAESSVKTVKKMMRKCLATKQDISQGLLSIRNTPLSCGASPAELLMNRQLNDNLPRLPSTMNQEDRRKRDMVAEREIQKKFHDRKINQRSQPNSNAFHPGQRVALQHHETKEWSLRGQIIKEVAPRSYDVEVNGKTLRRNRCQIRKMQSTTSYDNGSQRTQQNESDYDEEQYYSDVPDHEQYDNEHYPFAQSEHSEGEMDSDSTIPYGDSDADPETHEVNTRTTRSGRRVRNRHPTDYDEL